MPRLIPIILQVKGDADVERAARVIENAFKRINKGSDDASKSSEQSSKKITNGFKHIEQEADRSAKAANNSFSKYLGAEFFGGLARQAFTAFLSYGKQFVTDAVRLAQDMQNALLGVSTIAAFQGIDEQAAQGAVQNLRLVKAGIITVGDAAVGLKNLLQAGFGLDQSIILLERFSDTAAFGKQAALNYGDAIRSATEGIKNQNSILVDNAGITKNISVILKERGFAMEDLSDKVKGLSAREALYQGLLAESAAQLGDAEKLVGTYTGAVAAEDMAYQNLERSIGSTIIKNQEWVEATKITTEFVSGTTDAIKEENSETAKFVNNLIHYAAVIKATAPSVATTIYFWAKAGLQLLTGLASGWQGLLLRSFELVNDGIKNSAAFLVNTISGAINKVLGIARMLPSSISGMAMMASIPDLPMAQVTPTNLQSNVYFNQMRDMFGGMMDSMNGIGRSINEASVNLDRVTRAAGRRDWGVAGKIDREQGVSGGFGNVERAKKAADEDKKKMGRGGERARIDAENIREAHSYFNALGQAFTEKFGKTMPARWGGSGLHRRQGMDHRAAGDIGLNPDSPEGRWIMAWLDKQNIPYSAWTQRVVAPTGKVLSSGPHIHFGAPSGQGFGIRGFSSAEELERRQQAVVGKALTESAKRRALIPLTTSAPGLATMSGKGLPTPEEEFRSQRQTEVEEHLTAAVLRRRNLQQEAFLDYRSQTVELIDLESDLIKMRSQASDDQFTEQRRLLSAKTEELDLLRNIEGVKDQIANGPYNESLRIELALLEDINSMRRRDEEAIKAQNRAQLELADATIVHGQQVRASVMEHLASQRTMTEAWSDGIVAAYDKVVGFLDRGIEKLTHGIPIVTQLVSALVHQLTSRVFQRFLDMMFPPAGGGGSQGGSAFNPFGAGGGFRNSANTVTGGYAGGTGAAQYLQNTIGQTLQNQFFSGINVGSNISAPTVTLSSQNRTWRDIAAAVPGAYPGGDASTGAGASAKGFFASLSQAGGPLGLLLGAGIGSSIGGESRTGQVIGGVGGALAGISIAAALGSSSAASIGGAIATALGISSSIASIALPGIGVALLVGAMLLKRNAAKRKNETDRAALGENTYKSIINVLNAARDGQYTSAGAALADFDKIRADYFSHIAGYDSKTKRIATETWNGTPQNPGYEAYRKLISETATKAIENRALGKNMIPEFSHGGFVPYRNNTLFSMASGLTAIKVRPGEVMIPPGGFGVTVPGVDRGYDSVYTMARPGTKVLTKSQASGARGFTAGGTLGNSNEGPTIVNVYLENQLTVGKETAGQIVEKGATTSNGQKVIVRVFNSAQADGEIR